MSTPNNKEESNKINIELKAQLLHILALIDQSILSHYTKKKPKPNHSYTSSPIDSFQSSLYYYQSQTNQLKERIAHSLRVSKLNSKEADLKTNQLILSNLTKENEVLTKINAFQTKGIKEISNSEASQAHKASLIYKNKNLKEEIRITKDYLNSFINKIKEQNKEIGNLNNLIQLIKSNVEWMKEQNYNGDTGSNSNTNNKSSKTETIKSLIKGQEEKQKKINEDLSAYQATMKEYDKASMRLDQEIALIEIELKHKEDLTRINNLKVKELKRIELNYLKGQQEKELKERFNRKSLIRNRKIVAEDRVNDLERQLQEKQKGNQHHFRQISKSNVMKQIEVLRKDIEEVLNADIEYRYNELNPNEQKAFNEEMGNMPYINSNNYHIDSNELEEEEEEEEDDNDNGNDSAYNNKLLKKKNSMAITPLQPQQEQEQEREQDSHQDSINENMKDDYNISIDQSNKYNTQAKGNEYHGIKTENKRRPFGPFEFPK